MQLDSYLEIFTTIYGWAFANILGEILVGTGVAAVPFALIVFNSWREAKESGRSSDIISILESVKTKLVTAVFVMMMCFATTPLSSLHNITLNHTPQSTLTDPNPETVNKETKDRIFSIPLGEKAIQNFSKAGDIAYAPAWWFSVMAISSGVNNAFRAGLSNSGSDLRRIEDMARTATIEDPKLLNSIQDFYSQCFIPAKSKYLRENTNNLTANGRSIVSADNKEYGPVDPDWMGSQLYRTEPGYYADMRSYNPVPGWVIDFSRDVDYIQTPAPLGNPNYGYENPDWGRPTCKQWWEDETIGIRKNMIDHSSAWRQLAIQTKTIFSSEEKSKDAVALLAQTQAHPQYVNPDAVLGAQHDVGTVLARTVGGIVSTSGTGIISLVTNITVGPLQNGMMMAQALTLMAIYMFLPIVVVFSGYDIKVFFLGALAIFTVKFWSVMWYVTNWVDGRLLDAMYPSGQFAVDYVVQTLQNTQKRMLLNIFLMGMHVGLPIIWTGLMTMVGIKGMGNINEITGDAGKTASNTVPKKLR